jgi:uncharacterized protein (TIGR03067 family)
MQQFLVAAACGLLLAVDSRTDNQAKGDQDKIQGTWVLVSAERNGKELPAEVVSQIRLVFAGDKLTTQHKERKTEAHFKLDPARTPKEIDLDMDGSIGKGIYQLEGDKLKIAHGEVGGTRPREFSKSGTGTTVLVLKRAKP